MVAAPGSEPRRADRLLPPRLLYLALGQAPVGTARPS